MFILHIVFYDANFKMGRNTHENSYNYITVNKFACK